MEIRNRFSPPLRVSVDFTGAVSRTKQSFKDEVDINRIMGRYAKGQVVDHLAKYEGQYGFATAMSFHEAMNLVAKAKEMFADLDSGIRKRFANEPGRFLEFVQELNEDGSLKNLEEMRKLGLAKPAPTAPLTPVEERVAELEVDRQARVEIARRAIVEPPAHTPT